MGLSFNLTFAFFRTCGSREQYTGPTKKTKCRLFSFFNAIQTPSTYKKKCKMSFYHESNKVQ